MRNRAARRALQITAILYFAALAGCQSPDEASGAAGDASMPSAPGNADAPAGYHVPPDYASIPGPEQPVPFNHATHAGTLAQPCALCHIGADAAGLSDPRTANGAHMTLPELSVCMNCHATIASEAESIRQLVGLHASGEAASWQRVYRVLPGVNWSHRPHIDAGLACAGCHGDVTSMDVMSIKTAVTAMASCIGCHRAGQANPECVTCHSWPRPEDI